MAAESRVVRPSRSHRPNTSGEDWASAVFLPANGRSIARVMGLNVHAKPAEHRWSASAALGGTPSLTGGATTLSQSKVRGNGGMGSAAAPDALQPRVLNVVESSPALAKATPGARYSMPVSSSKKPGAGIVTPGNVKALASPTPLTATESPSGLPTPIPPNALPPKILLQFFSEMRDPSTRKVSSSLRNGVSVEDDHVEEYADKLHDAALLVGAADDEEAGHPDIEWHTPKRERGVPRAGAGGMRHRGDGEEEDDEDDEDDSPGHASGGIASLSSWSDRSRQLSKSPSPLSQDKRTPIRSALLPPSVQVVMNDDPFKAASPEGSSQDSNPNGGVGAGSTPASTAQSLKLSSGASPAVKLRGNGVGGAVGSVLADPEPVVVRPVVVSAGAEPSQSGRSNGLSGGGKGPSPLRPAVVGRGGAGSAAPSEPEALAASVVAPASGTAGSWLPPSPIVTPEPEPPQATAPQARVPKVTTLVPPSLPESTDRSQPRSLLSVTVPSTSPSTSTCLDVSELAEVRSLRISCCFGSAALHCAHVVPYCFRARAGGFGSFERVHPRASLPPGRRRRRRQRQVRTVGCISGDPSPSL